MQVLSKPRALQRVAVSLENTHIAPNPLLNEYGEECRGKTEDQGNKPERVHPDGRRQRVESRVGRWRIRRDGDLWGDGSQLTGDLVEHRDVLLQVIHRLVCRTRLQILLSVD